MAKVQEIGPYSAYAIAVKYGYKGTEEEWVKEQEANRKAAEAAAAAAEQSAKNAAASASGVAQSGQQAVQSIKDAQTSAEQAIDTAKQQAVQAAQAEAVKASASAGQAASSAAEAAQSATNAAAEVGKVQSAGTSAVQAVQQAQSTATEAVSDAQQSATQAVSEAQATAVSAVQEAGTAQTSAVESAGTAAVSAVSNAKTEALTQISTAGTAQVSAVGTAGADAVEDVNDAKTAALEEIDAANAALPSPTQSDAGKVPTVKADGSAYELAGPYAPLSAAIRPTASGNPVSITDSVEWPLQGLKVYGKSTQDGTPSPENPVPIVSAGDSGMVGLSINNNGYLMKGSYAGNIQSVRLEKGITYIFYCSDNTNSTNCFAFSNGEHSFNTSGELFHFGYSVSGLTVINDTGIVDSACRLPMKYNTPYKFKVEADDLYFYQGINNAGKNTDEAYLWSESEGEKIPYKSQSLTLSTPNGLPGIPVDSGGNYTDAEGQQWVCDEIDYARKMYMQRIGIYQPETNLEYITEGGITDGQTILCRCMVFNGKNPWVNMAMCNFISKKSMGTWTSDEECYSYASDGYLDFRILKSRLAEVTRQGVKDFCQSINATFLYVLVNPIETHIPPEELAAYRALHTYDGATVVSTAEDVARLEVKYLADGEKYVERIVSQKAPEAAAAHTMALLADGIREGVNGV